jgi:hypothetical protein
MGEQACVLYGGAEFSRDTDLVVLSEAANLARLGAAACELDAHPIAVPPFQQRYLDEGLAIHFRCRAAGVEGMRLDVMSRIRGRPDFETLWDRRTTIDTGEQTIDVLSLPDLVTAKKTQRDKDWPMITRLLEAHWTQTRRPAPAPTVDFWLRELRTLNLLTELARDVPADCRRIANQRPLLSTALAGDEAAVARLLREEEEREREADRQYWAPLRRRLETLRQQRRDLS